MKHYIRYMILALTMLTSLSGCHHFQNETDIVLLFTSDVRGNFLGYNYLEDKQYHYGLASFSTLVKEQRALYGDRLLVMDAGERLVTSPALMYSQLVDSLNEPQQYAMSRYIGYDLLGLGLSDRQEAEVIDPKHHDPNKQAPIVCANVVDRSTGEPIFSPYKIFERQGIKIAVMGISDRMLDRWVQDDKWANTSDQDIEECIRKWMPEIQRQCPDIIVGLFHKVEVTPAMVAPFDVVLTSLGRNPFQTTVSPWEGHHVPVIGASRHASHAGLVKIHLKKRTNVNAGEQRFEKQINSSIVDLDDFEQDADFVARWKPFNDTLIAWVNKPLGYMSEVLNANSGIFGCDKYRRMLQELQLESTGADIAMASCLTPNTIFEPSVVSIHNIYELYPHDNQLVTFKMTLDEIRNFLEYGYAMQFRTIGRNEKTTDPLLYRYDKKGHLMYTEEGEPRLKTTPENYTSAAGIIYEVDITKPAGQRVRILGFEDGREMDTDAMYNVCLNSFQAGSDFITKGLGWTQETLKDRTVPATSRSMRQIIYEHFSKKDTVRVAHTDNWRIVPSNLLDTDEAIKTYHAAW